MTSIYTRTLDQLHRLQSIQYLEANLKDPAFSMPQNRNRSAGFDPEMWYGLGIVGIWAALDALADRAGLPTTGRFSDRFIGRVEARSRTALDEIEDLRNLYAHNFAGVADEKYLTDGRRRVLTANNRHRLTCGLQFSGVIDERVRLTLDHLLWYIAEAEKIVCRFL